MTRRREDGYHDIETVFYPLPLHDVLEAVPATTTTLHQSGLPVAGNTHDNLVWKAYELLCKEHPDKVPPLDIYLHKTIPMGAGLGGGSADGAYMLRLLNDYCSLGLSNTQLAEYALQLGSDCPFFIYNTPQLATGRGELMSDINVQLAGYSIQLICPAVHVATGKAFQAITPRAAGFDLSTLGNVPVTKWKNCISNDFEVPVFAQHPVLSDIKQELYAQGAVYAAMSGSGSSIFGIFPKGRKAVVKADIPFKMVYME